MDDLISRQAAIDALKKYIAVNKNPNHDARIWEEGINCAVSVIGSLPSAQSKSWKVGADTGRKREEKNNEFI